MIKKLDFIEEICLYLFVFFCCFPQKISSTFLIVYGAVFLLNRITQLFVNKTFSIIISKRTIPAIILICFSLISFITLIYVDSTESALKRMFEQRLTLLLLPLVALLKQNKLDFSAFFKVFVLGNFFFVVYSFLYVIYQYWIIENVILQRDFLANFTHICCALQYRTYACFNLVNIASTYIVACCLKEYERLAMCSLLSSEITSDMIMLFSIAVPMKSKDVNMLYNTEFD